jgi:hypothetical protein
MISEKPKLFKCGIIYIILCGSLWFSGVAIQASSWYIIDRDNVISDLFCGNCNINTGNYTQDVTNLIACCHDLDKNQVCETISGAVPDDKTCINFGYCAPKCIVKHPSYFPTQLVATIIFIMIGVMDFIVVLQTLYYIRYEKYIRRWNTLLQSPCSILIFLPALCLWIAANVLVIEKKYDIDATFIYVASIVSGLSVWFSSMAIAKN